MAYLDDWYSTLARNLKVGNKKRFFWKGYEGAPGDMDMATSLFKDVLNAFTGQGGEEDIKPLALRWVSERVVETSVFSACLTSGSTSTSPVIRQAEFDSPAARYLPKESQTGQLLYVWRTGGVPPSRLAIILPTTGDAFFWFRKQIALDLLTHDIASVIPMIPFYGKRKPKEQWHHLICSVADFFKHICSGVLEAAAIGAWAASEFPGVNTVFTGVSMGGSIANVAAILAAANSSQGKVGACPVVATCSATSFLTGVLHNRIAWKELSEAPSGVADELKNLVAVKSAHERAKVTKESGEELLPTEQDLADTIEVLNLAKIVRLVEENQREVGGQLPMMLDAVVQVQAANDRFVGREGDELEDVLKRLVRKGEDFQRVDITGGHISTLMRRESAIVPAIVATFSKFSEGYEDSPVEAPQGVNRL